PFLIPRVVAKANDRCDGEQHPCCAGSPSRRRFEWLPPSFSVDGTPPPPRLSHRARPTPCGARVESPLFGLVKEDVHASASCHLWPRTARRRRADEYRAPSAAAAV